VQALAAAVAVALGGVGGADPAAPAAVGLEAAAAVALLQTLTSWAATPHGAAGCRRLVTQQQVVGIWSLGAARVTGWRGWGVGVREMLVVGSCALRLVKWVWDLTDLGWLPVGMSWPT
jgi:hypothetical protein